MNCMYDLHCFSWTRFAGAQLSYTAKRCSNVVDNEQRGTVQLLFISLHVLPSSSFSYLNRSTFVVSKSYFLNISPWVVVVHYHQCKLDTRDEPKATSQRNMIFPREETRIKWTVCYADIKSNQYWRYYIVSI